MIIMWILERASSQEEFSLLAWSSAFGSLVDLNFHTTNKKPCVIIFFSYIFFKKKLDIPTFVTGILAGLVSITGICF